MTGPITLADAEALDRTDSLAGLRNAFELPPGVIYLDGNSLGPLAHAVRSRMDDVIRRQWGEGLIRSWNTHDWIDLPAKVGDRIAPLIGAPPKTVTVADSTSLNLFKVLSVALSINPDRKVIVTEKGNFPTDLYILEGVTRMLGQGHHIRIVETGDILEAIDENVAVLLLTEVNYRTGRRLDMAALSARARADGVLTVWDLAHSAGAFPVYLAAAGADFAVGCGYKYLNGGPGAPAFVYVSPRHLTGLSQPLTGWMGHAQPFAFEEQYRSAGTIEAMRVGTPPILSLSALDAALELFEGVDLSSLKRKADHLFDLFAAEVEALCPQLELVTPKDARQRGTQISFRFPEAYAVMQALIARGVIGDFREPDILRFGLTPMYLSHADIWHAARTLGDIMSTGVWQEPNYRVRAKVV